MILAALLAAAAARAAPQPPPDPVAQALEERGRVALYVPFRQYRPDLDAGARRLLEAAARALARKPGSVLIEAHVFCLATPQQNLALSDVRARNVRRALVALGVGAKRLSTAGMGSSRPIVEEAKQGSLHARNERIELVDPAFSGTRAYMALEAPDLETDPSQPAFRLIPDYYISDFQQYDSWKGGRTVLIGGQVLEGRATLIFYRHMDADAAGVRLPDAAEIRDDYARALEAAGAQPVSRAGPASVFKIENARRLTWVELDAANGRQFRVTVLDAPGRGAPP